MKSKSHTKTATTTEKFTQDTHAKRVSFPDVSYDNEERQELSITSDIIPSQSSQQGARLTVAEAVAKMLEPLGVKYAFGVSGRGMAPLWDSLERSPIQVLHFRHEAAAAFAAVESYFATYKIPRVIDFVDSIPKNPTGKVLKRILQQETATSFAAVSY